MQAALAAHPVALMLVAAAVIGVAIFSRIVKVVLVVGAVCLIAAVVFGRVHSGIFTP